MKIVCDTNVLISGVLFGGHARQILRLASRGILVNYFSPDVLREVQEVLQRPKFGLDPRHVLGIVALFKDTFELVTPSSQVHAIPSDPQDNHVIEAALAAQAEYIISGDKHLLNLAEWKGIRIIPPAEFMRTIMRPTTQSSQSVKGVFVPAG